MPDIEKQVPEPIEIEIVPDEPVTPPAKEEPATPRQDDEEEYGEYGERVRKRIAKETAKRRQAERERDELRARSAQYEQQIQQHSHRVNQVDYQAVESQTREIEARLSQAQREYIEARQLGDATKEFDAINKVGQYRADAKALEVYRQQRGLVQPPQQQPAQQVAQQREPEAHPLAMRWAEENSGWWQKDRAMTGAAYGVDTELKEEGYDAEAPEFYAELNRRMREHFPSKFQQRAQRGVQQPVNGVTRGGSTPNKIRVTETQVTLAKRLGLPVTEYAKYQNLGREDYVVHRPAKRTS